MKEGLIFIHANNAHGLELESVWSEWAQGKAHPDFPLLHIEEQKIIALCFIQLGDNIKDKVILNNKIGI